jgi:hypothetical protein
MSAVVEGKLANAIVEILRQHDGQATFEYLWAALHDGSDEASETDVKAALWALVSRSALELTPSRTFRLAA